MIANKNAGWNCHPVLTPFGTDAHSSLWSRRTPLREMYSLVFEHEPRFKSKLEIALVTVAWAPPGLHG
jgi:hypothetical protein